MKFGVFENGCLGGLYEHMRKHYRLYSFTANMLIALAIGGLAFLGILNTVLTVQVLFTWGAVLATVYVVGKWLDQEVDDLGKLREHECEIPIRCVKRSQGENSCNCDSGSAVTVDSKHNS